MRDAESKDKMAGFDLKELLKNARSESSHSNRLLIVFFPKLLRSLRVYYILIN